MIRIGISGWRYEPWRGVFCPEGLAQGRELEDAAGHFPPIADVRAFGLNWSDCEDLLRQLGFHARIEIVTS